jgi:hypothetical protein
MRCNPILYFRMQCSTAQHSKFSPVHTYGLLTCTYVHSFRLCSSSSDVARSDYSHFTLDLSDRRSGHFLSSGTSRSLCLYVCVSLSPSLPLSHLPSLLSFLLTSSSLTILSSPLSTPLLSTLLPTAPQWWDPLCIPHRKL